MVPFYPNDDSSALSAANCHMQQTGLREIGFGEHNVNCILARKLLAPSAKSAI